MKTSPLALFDALDLEPIMVKAMDAEEGFGWSLDQTKIIAIEYKKFLTLCMLHPEEPIVPSTLVDDFWHLHILDTQKYAEDCENYLGYFLHHFPYFGMRGASDLENLKKAWMKTLDLYLKIFHHLPDTSIWMKSKRCPSCGGNGCKNGPASIRPKLADLIEL